MRPTPMISGFIYLILGSLFTYIAIQQIQLSGWGFFVYFLILLATIDVASGLRLILLHFVIRNKKPKQ